jgi:hypothetical protein
MCIYIYICIHFTYIFIIIFGIPDSGAMNHILFCFDHGTYGELWDPNSKDWRFSFLQQGDQPAQTLISDTRMRVMNCSTPLLVWTEKMTQVVQNVLLHLWLTINDWVSFEWSTHRSLLSLVDLGPRFILPTLPISCVEKDIKKTMIGPNIITSIASWKNSLVRHLKKARVSQKLHRNGWNLVIGPQGGCAKGPRVYHIACRAVNEIGRSIQSWDALRPCNKCETISFENDHHPGILKDFPLVWCLSHVLFCWIMMMKWLMINVHFILSHSVFFGCLD